MKTIKTESRKFVSAATALLVILFGIIATGCGGSSSTTSTGGTLPPGEEPGIEVPGTVENLNVEATIGAILSATVSWSEPTTGGEASSYEIYRSTTSGTTFSPENHLVSIPAVEGQSDYEFVDNAGLERNVETYWVVAAKNISGETPSIEVMYTPSGGAGGEIEGFGNNFSAAMIFADGYGITGLELEGEWSLTEDDPEDWEFNTGFRPGATEEIPEFPYFDEDTTYELDGVVYYKQKTASTWQGEWRNGEEEEQHVTAAWGDNLISQSLNSSSVIRIETVLTKDLGDDNMTSYTMKSLYGEKYNEIYGTDMTTYENNTAFVFATNARLTIQKLDDEGEPIEPALISQPLWTGDGPRHFTAEVNVAGNFTYGFVWNLGEEDLSGLPYGKVGTWRITFSLDEEGPEPVEEENNTYIDSVTNGVKDSDTEIHIDVQIAQ